MAVVGGTPITVDVFENELAGRTGRMAGEGMEEELLGEMINLEMLYAASIKAGYENDPEILAGLKMLLVNKYRQDVLEPRLAGITVSEPEVEDYYRGHRGNFTTEGMVRAAIIKISVPKMASDEKRAELLARAEAALAEAQGLDPETRSFGSVAVKYSDDQASRYRGGDTGWLRRGSGGYRWDDVITDALFALTVPGKVSPVITASDGFYIIKLVERKKSELRPLEEVRDIARHKALLQKREQVIDEFYGELRAVIPVEINLQALESVKAARKKYAEEHEPRPPELPVR